MKKITLATTIKCENVFHHQQPIKTPDFISLATFMSTFARPQFISSLFRIRQENKTALWSLHLLRFRRSCNNQEIINDNHRVPVSPFWQIYLRPISEGKSREIYRSCYVAHAMNVFNEKILVFRAINRVRLSYIFVLGKTLVPTLCRVTAFNDQSQLRANSDGKFQGKRDVMIDKNKEFWKLQKRPRVTS